MDEIVFKSECTLSDIGERAAKIIEEHTKKIDQTTMVHLTLFAQAFDQELGCKPSECELVLEYKHATTRWFFRKRKEQ